MEEKELFSHIDEVDSEKFLAMLKKQAESKPLMDNHITKNKKSLPLVPLLVLGVIVIFTLLAGVIYPKDPSYMELGERSLTPSSRHFFGTDSLGRDVFGMVVHGGQLSLLVGGVSTIISTIIAVIMGCLTALLPKTLRSLLSRFIDLVLSIPSILLMIFIQAITGGNTWLSISLSIGLSSWMTMAKMIKAQVNRIKGEEYIYLAKYYGGGFFYLLKKHFLPTLVPIIFFMAFTGLGHAITAEATLSFLGIGFPMEIITWGSLLSLSGQALLTKSWWVIIIPGVFLVLTVVSLVEIGDYIRKRNGIEKKL